MKIINAEWLMLVPKPKPKRKPKPKPKHKPYYPYPCPFPERKPIAEEEKFRPRLEVFSVDMECNDPGELYGAITVIDSFGNEDIYNAKGGDYSHESSSGRGKELLLTGPNRYFRPLDGFFILVRLTKNESRLSADNSHWRWSWHLSWEGLIWESDPFSDVYGKRLSYTVKAPDFGSVTLNYALFRTAVSATVEVMLINNYGNNNPPAADVCGQITARNTNLEEYGSLLFRKKKSGDIHVKPGQLIPLSRSVVAVPLKSSLIICGHLWDCNRISPNNEIAANFSVEFPAQFDYISVEKNISGQYGEIQVKVTWVIDEW